MYESYQFVEMTRGVKRSVHGAQLTEQNNTKIFKSMKKEDLRQPLSLLDCCAKAVASKISFQEIEETFARIPEPVQLRVIYWSFPYDEEEIRMYSTSAMQHQKMPFEQGLKLLKTSAVNDVLQVGFHLSGRVQDDDESFKVSVNFDRCKITCVSCSCGSKDILWCSHVVALALYRIRFPNAVTLRVPISETLLKMNRNQLQKLVQYLITAHHTEVLSTAQRLADEILHAKSEINLLQGAPDPTAGGAVEDDNRWHLDAEQVQEQVKAYLSQGTCTSNGKQLHCMFAKVRELLRVQDCNGARMLTLITEQFLADPKLQQNVTMTDKCRQLWNHLGSLWTCIALNPNSGVHEKILLKKKLQHWSDLEACPIENKACENSGKQTVFSRALSACDLDWNCGTLQKILKSDGQNLVWLEDLCTSAARIDALKTHGFQTEALRLAVAVANGLKQIQDVTLQKIRNENLTTSVANVGWIGNVLEPIPTLYDTLTEATDECTTDKPYITLAVEVALIGLSQHRRMPKTSFAQHKSSNEEEQLIAQLSLLKLDSQLLNMIREQSCKILDIVSSDGSGLCVDKNSTPLQTFARYLFNVLIHEDRELAFQIGMSALQSDLPRNESSSEIKWHTLRHLEAQQCELAACLIKSCKDDKDKLESVLVLVKKHIHNASYLFRLAQDILKLKCSKQREMCESALDLGLHILSSTLYRTNCKRRDVIHWLLGCSLQLDKSVLVTIIQNWQSLFTPTEVTNCVAPIALSQCAYQELQLTIPERASLRAYIQGVVFQCINKDPQSCALSALTLSENDPKTFETAYRIIVESAGSISPTHLFAIARYTDHKNHPVKAFHIASLAIKHSSVVNNDSGPSVGDVHWACGLAHALGKTELAHTILLIVNAVQCPSVLSDLLHRCTLTPAGVAQVNPQCNSPTRLTYDDPCLQPLVEAAINAYVNCAHNKLNQISPKHYTDFTDFLLKAKEIFVLAKDGGKRFNALIENMKILYRGKRKLMTLVSQRVC